MASKASRAALLSLALIAATLFLQVAVADEAVSEAGNGDVVTASSNASIDSDLMPADVAQDVTGEDGGFAEDELPDIADQGSEDRGYESNADTMDGGGKELGEIQPYVYVPEAGEVEVVVEEEEQAQESSVEGRPLARILHQRSSKKCWSKKKCRKFYTWAGCCKKRCVNLWNDNRHCGRCGKCCDTKKGYCCKSGKCRKRQVAHVACSRWKKCKGENSCCGGKCVNVEHDCKNCGKCGRKCPFGSACCQGHCKSLKSDCQNCGKCGRKCRKGNVCCNGKCVCLKKSQGHCGACGKYCGWGRKCCHGRCVSVTSDKQNCGRCGKKCARNVKCRYGVCGYGL